MTFQGGRFKTALVSLVTAAAVAAMPVAATAADNEKARLPVVRDAEIESLVLDYARPVLKAAGLSRSGIEIVLVNDPAFNAFVAGRRIFINTGTILGSATPNQVIGVLAHEIGHLAGGHQSRLREQIERAKTISVVASLLGAGVMAAGAATGTRGLAQAGGGIMAGGGTIAMRNLFSYQRSEEATADRSALVYLEKIHQSPRGLLETFDTLARNDLFSTSRSSGYLSSHPAPRERIANLETTAKQSPYYDEADSLELLKRHDMARAKIAAYAGGASAVRSTFLKDPRSEAAAYGDAIATELNGAPADALAKIDALIKRDPKVPWFHEVRGEILMQSRRSEEAAAAFARAAALDTSKSGLLQASIGQALVTSGKAEEMPKAIQQIRRGLIADPDNSTAYRFLAMAYNQVGDVGNAELATAEGYWHAGALKQSQVFAARAQQKLKPGTPGWRQAQDILTFRRPKD
ncbi:M48 family metalloprotease [Mangrovicella endophytica]|uniref:M48 family metalloprotease n=1 Tax=Mangrovicella endophytica TaxID=2066697 RepID=UPI000C9DCAF3|nr:M48 family metalloprotease [Mangrovicella endophytica]